MLSIVSIFPFKGALLYINSLAYFWLVGIFFWFAILVEKGPLLAFNLNICQILDIASPLAIFHHLCQFSVFDKRATLKGAPFGIQFVYIFFAICAILAFAFISKHKCFLHTRNGLLIPFQTPTMQAGWQTCQTLTTHPRTPRPLVPHLKNTFISFNVVYL